MVVPKTRDTIARGCLGECAVRRIPAQIVVLKREMVAIVELPVEFWEQDELAGTSRHQAGFVHQAGDELVILLQRIAGQRHAETLLQCCEIRRGELPIEERGDVAGARDGGKIAVELIIGEEPEDAVRADRAAGGNSPLLAVIGWRYRYGRHGAVGL